MPDTHEVGRRTLWLGAALLVGVIFLAVPRPHGSVAEHLHKEDGTVFLTDYLQDPAGSLTQSYTGYQHAAPRLITAGCAQLRPADFAACVTGASHGFRAILGLAAFFVLLPLVRSWRWAVAAASLFLFVPVGQQEVLGNLTNLRWFCDAAAVLMLCGIFTRVRAAIPMALLAAVCALSDPLAVLIAPLALWPLLRSPNHVGRLVPIAYLAASAAHWLVLDRGARSSSLLDLARDPAQSVEQVLVRGPMIAQLGQNGAELAIMAVGLPLALLSVSLPAATLALGWRRMRFEALAPCLVMVLWGLGLLLVTISFASMSDIAITESWRVGQASRYSLAPGLLLGIALVVAASHAWSIPRWPRWVSAASLATLVVAIAADFPGDRSNTRGPTWRDTVAEARAACAADPDAAAVAVQVTPTGVPMDWGATLICDWLE